MAKPYRQLLKNKANIVFLGEAGCGKSEAALHFAMRLAGEGGARGHVGNPARGVHLFDLDQTKPIFRSRDARDVLAQAGVALHHAAHDFDSPTIVGGVAECLADPACHAILDVGGGEIGARIIGRFARQLNQENTLVFYVLNPYRPWSRQLLAVDETLSAILRVTRIQRYEILCNPHLGPSTTAAEALAGFARARDMLGARAEIAGVCAREEIAEQVAAQAGVLVLPLQLYLQYEWEET